MSLLDFFEDAEFACDELVTADELIRVYERDRPSTVALDTESPTYRWHLADADPFCFTVSWGWDKTFYVDVRDEERSTYEKTHYEEDSSNHRILEEAANAAWKIFVGTERIVFHHAKYDLHVFKRMFDAWNLPLVTRRVDDTMLMSPVIDEARYHGLKELCKDLGIAYSDEDADAARQRIDDWRSAHNEAMGRMPRFDEVPLKYMVPYAVGDAYLTYELFKLFDRQIDEQGLPLNKPPAERDLRRIYELELKVLWVLFDAEERGIRVDLDFVTESIAELTPQLEDIRSQFSRELGWNMNPGSVDDVAKALKQVGIEGEWVNYKTGRTRLPEWVLEDIDHPFAKRVLEFRTAQKLLSTYFEALQQQYRMDRRMQAIVRCNVKQNGARTGRLSITEPALQTIPREKGNVRAAFIAREGHVLLGADFEAQELRVLAHFLAKLGDDSMLKVFEAGRDLHQETGAAIYNVAYEDCAKGTPGEKMRYDGKTLNFAIVYGAGQRKIASMLGIPEEQARRMLDTYYDRFPGIRKLKRMTTRAMEQRQWVVTPWGRRHRERDGKYAYKAINSLVQGASADMNKAAMVKVRDLFIANEVQAVILLQVHDEILCEVTLESQAAARACMERGMTDFPELAVPMKVDVKSATSWAAL